MAVIDSLIRSISPAWALKREEARAQLLLIDDFKASYDGAYGSRVSTPYTRSMSMTGIREMIRWRQMNMRDRAREMERNNSLARGMLDRAVENIIGPGMEVEARTADPDFNLRAMELWRQEKDQFDITGMREFGDLQKIIFRSALRDGDVGCVMVRRGLTNRIQVIEGDYIDSMNKAALDTPSQVHGIDLNGDSRPTAFHVIGYQKDNARTETVVPARNFIFLTNTNRATEIRGEPVFAQVFDKFDSIDKTIEAVVLAARIAACFGAVVRSGMSGSAFPNLQTAMNSQGNQQRLATIEPGMIQYLKPGEDIVQINPTQPAQNFPEFIATLLRFIGVNLGMPLELILLDFSRTNYSSARASLQQAYRAFRSRQTTFKTRVLVKLWRWWISSKVKNGQLIVPPAIAQNFWKHEWIAPGWSWVDPTKEIQAAMMEVDGGFNTLTNIAMQHGRDFYELVQQRKRELEVLAEAGITTSRSVATRDLATAPHPAAPENGNDASAGDGDLGGSDDT